MTKTFSCITTKRKVANLITGSFSTDRAFNLELVRRAEISGLSRCSQSECWRKPFGFTLIELLAVLSIIGVMASLIVGVSGSMLSSTKLTTSTGLVAGTVTMARTMALSSGRLTRFVVVEHWPGVPDANFRRFSIWQMDKESRLWEQTSRWEKLPDGVVFDPSQSKEYATQSPSLMQNPQSKAGPDLLVEIGSQHTVEVNGVEVLVRAIEFSPRGRLRGLGSSDMAVWFTLAEGFREGSGGMVYTAGKSSDDSPANWRHLSVSSLLGRLSINEP